MKRLIVMAILLSLGVPAFAEQKSVKPQTSATGILIASSIIFSIQGDGITTTFTFSPRRIGTFYPATTALPRLPLVGLFSNGGNCVGNEDDNPFTGTVSKGLLTVNFASAPPANTEEQCTATLLFQPE